MLSALLIGLIELFIVLLYLVAVYSLRIRAEDEDVLVVGFHEVALTGNLLDSLRMQSQLTQFTGGSLVSLVIHFYLVVELADSQPIPHMHQQAVLIEKAYQGDTDHDRDQVFVVRLQTERHSQFGIHPTTISIEFNCKGTANADKYKIKPEFCFAFHLNKCIFALS